MTTIGDIEYESAAGTAARLAGNTASTKNFLTSTGSGGTATAPAWGTIATGDLPAQYLPLSGGTMSGPLNMGAQQISNIGAGVASTDVVQYAQVAALQACNESGYATWTYDPFTVYVVNPAFSANGVASGVLLLSRFLYLPYSQTLNGYVDMYWNKKTAGASGIYVGVYSLGSTSGTIMGSGSPDLTSQATSAYSLHTGVTSWPAGWYAFGYLADTQASSGQISSPFCPQNSVSYTVGYAPPGDNGTVAPIPRTAYYNGSYGTLPTTITLSNFTSNTSSYCLMQAQIR